MKRPLKKTTKTPGALDWPLEQLSEIDIAQYTKRKEKVRLIKEEPNFGYV